ncbi:MAG: hypothetical protein K2P58_03575 [Hyphomonadaceae bacterium]|nr:hypothetical protein [Hyphomonadaceae bacterium]
MSLNKTLDRLFDEIRREAKRNPAFADRLDAVLRLHDSRREVSDEVLEGVAREEPAAPKAPDPSKRKTAPAHDANTMQAVKGPPPLNPAGLYKREGEEALAAALAAHDIGALQALVAEHNLDPGGVASGLTREELAAHIVAQAKRRAERDDKMFDY